MRLRLQAHLPARDDVLEREHRGRVDRAAGRSPIKWVRAAGRRRASKRLFSTLNEPLLLATCGIIQMARATTKPRRDTSILMDHTSSEMM